MNNVAYLTLSRNWITIYLPEEHMPRLTINPHQSMKLDMTNDNLDIANHYLHYLQINYLRERRFIFLRQTA